MPAVRRLELESRAEGRGSRPAGGRTPIARLQAIRPLRRSSHVEFLELDQGSLVAEVGLRTQDDEQGSDHGQVRVLKNEALACEAARRAGGGQVSWSGEATPSAAHGSGHDSKAQGGKGGAIRVCARGAAAPSIIEILNDLWSAAAFSLERGGTCECSPRPARVWRR
jgi:hypothetical protein